MWDTEDYKFSDLGILTAVLVSLFLTFKQF